MKRRYYQFVLLLSLAFFALEAPGQDPHFSQFYLNSVDLNPALTGVIPDKGAYRAQFQYRNQWIQTSPFSTIRASADGNFLNCKIGNDILGFGISALHDVWDSTHLSNTSISLSTAYSKNLIAERDIAEIKQFNLGLGFQGTFQQRRINAEHLRFGSIIEHQINYDPQISNDLSATKTAFGLSAGIYGFMVFKNDISLGFGISAFHINRPNISFLDGGSDRLHRRFTGHFSLNNIQLSDNLRYHIKSQFTKQGPSLELVVGNILEISSSHRARRRGGKDLSLSGIFMYRMVRGAGPSILNSDALILGAAFRINRLTLGLTYDLTISKGSEAFNFNGGPELSLRYVFGSKKKVGCRQGCPGS